jgi:hypothetical protein
MLPSAKQTTEVPPLAALARGRMTHFRWTVVGLVCFAITINYIVFARAAVHPSAVAEVGADDY